MTAEARRVVLTVTAVAAIGSEAEAADLTELRSIAEAALLEALLGHTSALSVTAVLEVSP